MAFKFHKMMSEDVQREFAQERLRTKHLKELSPKLMVMTAWYYWVNSFNLQPQRQKYPSYDVTFLRIMMPLLWERLFTDHCPEALKMTDWQKKEYYLELHKKEIGPYAWRMTEDMFQEWLQANA